MTFQGRNTEILKDFNRVSKLCFLMSISKHARKQLKSPQNHVSVALQY